MYHLVLESQAQTKDLENMSYSTEEFFNAFSVDSRSYSTLMQFTLMIMQHLSPPLGKEVRMREVNEHTTSGLVNLHSKGSSCSGKAEVSEKVITTSQVPTMGEFTAASQLGWRCY